MTKEQYLRTMTTDEEVVGRLLSVMEKYESNHWWLSDDIKRMSFYQLQEDNLLIEFEVFHKGVGLLLEREVQTNEFRDLRILFEEAKTKYSPA